MSRTLALLALLMIPVSGISQTSSDITIRGKGQKLNLYGSSGNSPILLSSGDLGWAGLVVHVAEFLSSQGYYVVGLNTKLYLASFTSKNSALDPKDVPGDYRTLLSLIRQSNATKPVFVGISEGAGLSVLAATHPDIKASIQGILALGLPDQNELGWKWQDFTIWVTKKTPNEPSFMVEDIIGKVSPLPLAEIHSTHDEFLPVEKAKAMFSKAGEPKKMWVIEASNHRFSESRPQLDRRILEALQCIKNSRERE
jgi:hypothetical protein